MLTTQFSMPLPRNNITIEAKDQTNIFTVGASPTVFSLKKDQTDIENVEFMGNLVSMRKYLVVDIFHTLRYQQKFMAVSISH
jgi:hypothetical protein